MDKVCTRTMSNKDNNVGLNKQLTLDSSIEGGIMEDYKSENDDLAAMESMGKEQVFERRITLMGAIGLCVCMSATYEGISASMFTALLSAGPAGLVWGFLICAVGFLFVAASLAEIASVWPTSGAQYHWTAELAPTKWKALLSWLIGFCSVSSSMLATLGMSFAFAVQIQAYAIIGQPSYVPQRWHVVLLVYACLTIYVLGNIFLAKILDNMNKAAMIVHMVFFCVIIIVLLATQSQKNSAEYIFTDIIVSSGQTSSGIAFCIGLQTSALGFVAVDGPAHFSEELHHAPRNVPRAIFWTVATTACVTFPWIIALAFSMGSIPHILESPIAISSPLTVILLEATGNPGASIFLSIPVIFVGFVGGWDIMGSGSRVIWALARDKALPNRLAHVHKRWNVPVLATILFSIPIYLLALIYLWNTTAFYSIISGILITQMPTYLIPVVLRLSKRDVPLGPWNLGKYGFLVHSVSTCWCIFLIVFLCFPAYQPVTADNMNYAIAILCAVGVLTIGGYIFYGRKRYDGPVRQLAH